MGDRVETELAAGELLTVQDVAALLGVSPQTIYNWVYAFELPHRRLGPSKRVIRFTAEDIDEYVAASAR